MPELGRYSKVYRRIWRDEKFRQLSDDGKLLFLRLLTAPEGSSIPGVVPVRAGALAEELRWENGRLREAFEETFSKGMVKADWGAGLVWLPNAVRYGRPESVNVVVGWRRQWAEVPECGLKAEAYPVLKAYAEGFGKAYADAFAKAIGEPSRSPATPEPDPEPEHEPDPEGAPSCAREEPVGKTEPPEPATHPLAPAPGVRVLVHRDGTTREVEPTEGTGLPGIIAREWVEVLAERGVPAIPDPTGAGVCEEHLRHLTPDLRRVVLRAFRDDDDDFLAANNGRRRLLRFLDAGRVNAYLAAASAAEKPRPSRMIDPAVIAALDEQNEGPEDCHDW